MRKGQRVQSRTRRRLEGIHHLKKEHRHYSTVSDDEYVTASRAARSATWGAVFYLITTDILGPFSTP